MNDLDRAILARIQPFLLPGETPQTAAWGNEYRTIVDLSLDKRPLLYHYVVITSERCFLLYASVTDAHDVEDPARREAAIKEIYELANCTLVKQDTQAGSLYCQLSFGKDGFFGIFSPRESALSTQASFVDGYLPWLRGQVESGALRTPERLARIEAQRLAAEAAKAAARAARDAEREAARAREASERDAHVRRTIGRQPAPLFFGTFAIAAWIPLALLAVVYQVWSIIVVVGLLADVPQELAEAKRKNDTRYAEILERNKVEYPQDIAGRVVKTVFFGGSAVAAGAASFGCWRLFRRKNAELRVTLQLPA